MVTKFVVFNAKKIWGYKIQVKENCFILGILRNHIIDTEDKQTIQQVQVAQELQGCGYGALNCGCVLLKQDLHFATSDWFEGSIRHTHTETERNTVFQ